MAPGCFATMNQDVNESERTVTHTTTSSSETFDINNKKLLIFNGDEIINLEDIPLPAEPAPLSSQNQIVLNNEKLDRQESETKVNFLKSIKTKKNSTKILFDTVDSFEILEQTIIKQKRLARLKNTDLRRKILLKRTFDLVCEIMDHENGFEPDTDSDEETNSKDNLSESSSSSESSSDESDSDEEESDKKFLNEPNLTLVNLEQSDTKTDSSLDDLYSNLDLIEFRFEDYVDQETQENRPQAQVPVKRRASSESDEDYSDDESDDYQLRDQQLNSINTNLTNLSNQLNLYNENRKKVYRKKRRFFDDQSENSLIRIFFLEDISEKSFYR